MSSKTIAVIGATGNQGFSVAETFLSLPNWQVRAITRNTSSKKAQELAAAGAEVVQADLADVDSLSRAFEGVHAIFVLTDFWATYVSSLMDKESRDVSSQQGYDTEVMHSMNAAIAASRTTTLENFIYSALGPMKAASGGKYPHSYHWESKAAAVDYIQNQQPWLAKKTSYIYLGAYNTNAFLLPKLNAKSGEYEMVMPAPKETRFPIIDASKSTGLFVQALIEGEKPGVKLLAYDSYITMDEALKIWEKAAGKQAKYVQLTLQAMQEATGVPMEVLDGAAFIGEFGYTAGLDDVIEPHQLKMKVETPAYEEFLKTRDSEYLLEAKYPAL